jgi:hypothetical protein
VQDVGGTFRDLAAPRSTDGEVAFTSGDVSVQFLGANGPDDGLVQPRRYGTIVITREPINVRATLEAIALLGHLKLHGMDRFKAHDEGRSVEAVLQGFLDRVSGTDPFDANIGWVYSTFRECAYARSEGFAARLVTGCRIEDMPPFHSATARARQLMATKSCSAYEVTRGVFALPRELRYILRSGLHGGHGYLAAVDVDLKSSHPRSVLRRIEERGVNASILRRVVDHRDEALLELHPNVDLAKQLVNGLINGGTIGAWTRKHNVGHRLPEWTDNLALLLQNSARGDLHENPRLVASCAKASGVTFWLNSIEERQNLDGVDAVVASKCGGTAVSYEGDGIFYVKRTCSPRNWAEGVVTSASVVAPCSFKSIPAFAEICRAVIARWGAGPVLLAPLAPLAPLALAAPVAPVAPEPEVLEAPVALMCCGDFDLHAIEQREGQAVVDVRANVMQSEDLFDGGKGRTMVLVYSKTKTPLEAFTDLADPKANAKGVLAASMADDVTMCLVVKARPVRLHVASEHYHIRTLMPTKVKLTDARIRDVYDTLAMHSHVANMESVGHVPAFVPDFEQICTWLEGHLKTRKYNDIVYECKRAVSQSTANPYEKALVKVAPVQMKEFADNYAQAVQSIRRVDDPTLKTYPKDFTASACQLRGVYWNDSTGIMETTLQEALDGDDELALHRTLIFVGRQNCGKTTLLRAVARELSHRQGFEVFADSTALDPFGAMTRAGFTKDIGAVCLNDFEFKSCLNQEFTPEMLKSLLDAGDTTSYNARYHCATLPGGRARLWAVNPETNDAKGEPDWGSWFRRVEVSTPLASLVSEHADIVKAFSECDKAIVRRAVIFKVTAPLFDPPVVSLEDIESGKRRRLAQAELRYQL